jgi:hypothetical protein
VAGPSVMVRVLGDITGLTKSFTDSGSKAQAAAKTAQQSFGTMLGVLNQSGVLGPFGTALSNVNDSIGHIIDHGKKMGDVMLGAGGAIAGAGVLFSTLGSKEQAAHQQLGQAIDNTGHSYDEYGKAIDEAVKKNEKYGQSSIETQNALAVLTQATHDPAEALKLLNTTTDVAAAKHEDLATAATQVGKVYNGNTKLLKEFGITTDKTTHLTKDHKTATQALADVVKGQAAASTDTFTGHLKALGTTLEDHVALFGEKYGPALQGVGGAMAGLGAVTKTTKAVMDVFSGGQKAAAAATDAVSASEDAAAVSEGLALWPILLIVAAIGVLIAIAYVLYRNWGTIWDGIKIAVKAVWDFIARYWPLLLAIILGPIGIAIDLVIKNWQRIKDAVLDVITWIRTHWPVLLAILTGPFGLAVLEIVRHWDDLVGFFTSLPGKIAGIAAGMWHGISDAFKDTINFLIDIWNKLHFTLPKINLGPFHVGGETIGVPHIPHLAQGGLITQTGLVLAHAGEAITPIDKVPRGPAVVIQNANFSTELDVDAFMRRAAWVMQTAKL